VANVRIPEVVIIEQTHLLAYQQQAMAHRLIETHPKECYCSHVLTHSRKAGNDSVLYCNKM